MTMILCETVDTSKDSEVLPLDLNQISPRYEERFSQIEDDVFRFNFPLEYTIRLGVQYDTPHIFLYKEDDELVFSNHDLEKDGLLIRPYLYNRHGDPKSCMINEKESAQFYVIPRYFAEGFNVGDTIQFSYHEQLLDEQERHIRCRRVT
jgi:hypothetical protein